MKNSILAKLIPAVFAVMVVILLFLWLGGVGEELEPRLPGNDSAPTVSAEFAGPVKLKGQLSKFDGNPADFAGSWPRFRGENFDGINSEDITLARQWPEGGPKELWSIDVGEGYAGAAVLAGRVYVVDYDKEKQGDVVRCLSLEDGRDIWRYFYSIKVKRFHGMSRTVPAVNDKYVVTVGPKCHVTCLDSVTGEFKWMYNLVREYKTTVPQWYTAQCPLIENDRAIIAPGGDVLMMAIDCETGEVDWQVPNPNEWVMTHSSIVPMEFKGRRFYIYCGGNTYSGGVVGVSSEDGSILWKIESWKMRTNVPSPVVVGKDRIFFSAGYGQVEKGCMMLKLNEVDDKIETEVIFEYKTEVFGSIQQTPIFYNDYIYGVGTDKQLGCMDVRGEIVWKSTSAKKFGHGPYIIADGLIYVMNDSGVLTMAGATPAGFAELGRAKVLEGPESWGPMAIASGRLILRDLNRMVCLDVTEN